MLPQAGPGEMLAPCDFPVLGKGRDRQGDKESEEQREGGREETEMEGRESEEGKDREAVRGGRERRQRKPC